MARNLRAKVLRDPGLVLQGPVSGKIGGIEISLCEEDQDHVISGLEPNTPYEAGQFLLRMQDGQTLAANYTESAAAFRPTSTQPGWTGPNYIMNQSEGIGSVLNLGGPIPGICREIAFFISARFYTTNSRTIFGGVGSNGLIYQTNRINMDLPYVNAAGTYQSTGRPNTGRDLLDASGQPRRVTVAGSLKHFEPSSPDSYLRMWSFIHGVDQGEWAKETDEKRNANYVDLRQIAANPGWAFGANTEPDGATLRYSYMDSYGFALFAGPTASVPDFHQQSVRDKFFDRATGTLNNRNLDVVCSEYASTLLFCKHGGTLDETSGGALSDGTANRIPPRFDSL